MRFPKLKRIRRYAGFIHSFGGFDREPAVRDGFFSDCENLTSSFAPLLSVRPERGLWNSVTTDADGEPVSFDELKLISGQGITAAVNAGGRLCFCTPAGVYIGGRKAEVTVDETAARHTLVPFGRSVFLVPEGILITETDEGFSTETAENMPLTDFAVEHNNRVWGCRCGENENGEFVNEIFASSLGDPLSWDTFDGISTDSYRASVGAPGEFTGVCVQGNDILFFKEDAIIRVSGNTPADFTVTAIPARGVESGASLSVVNLNEKVFYKTRGGINVFDGALSVCISDELGDDSFTDPAAGAANGKYYIAMTDISGVRKLFVFDTANGIWQKENDKNTRFFVTRRSCLYGVCLEGVLGTPSVPVNVYSFYIHDCGKSFDSADLFTDEPSQGFCYIKEEPVSWYAVTGKLGAEDGASCCLRTVSVRLAAKEGSSFGLSVLTGEDKTEHRLYFTDRPLDTTVSLPVRLPRCDSFRLKLYGKGPCTVSSLAYTFERSGEMNVYGR